MTDRVEIGVIGGSGLYEIDGLTEIVDRRVPTPFGEPSDVFRIGTLEGHRVAFLARHGRQHQLLPSEINYRANVYAMKTLGVERILSASAVGSMRESIHPREVVVPDQLIDRTHRRPSTFFGDGAVAHVGFAEPFCAELRQVLGEACREAEARVHLGGTYLCMEGPAFSTRAESMLYRSWGVDVIGMTNLQEAKLAREAEICYGTLALVTDYDCWHEEEEDVSVETLLDNLRANAALAARVIVAALHRVPARGGGCRCGEALGDALITPIEAIPPQTRERLAPLIGKYLDR